jgi:hypothetical protein
MIWIMLAWAQLGTGMSFPLLEWPEKEVAHLKCKWLQSICTGLSSIGARIKCIKDYVFKPQRTGDEHIMDKICDCKRFTPTQLCKIKACHLFLQVTLMSDIATPCGQSIDSAYYKGTISNFNNWPTVQYSRQHKPDKTSWALWQ